MKNKTCCFTGHRSIPNLDFDAIQSNLVVEIKRLIDAGYCFFGTGGALGFDTLAAQAVLSLKPDYPQIKLILVLPCKNQTQNWSQKDIDVYEEIKSKSDKVVYVSEFYTRDCMHKRNRHLVNYSSVCISYVTKSSGGSVYTVNYAKEQGLLVINIKGNQT